MLIANPIISQDELAVQFGYSASWISIILASDAFQAFHAKRTAELIDPALRATIEDRFKGLVYRSQEILLEKLRAPAASIPENLALRTMELSARALGFGARDPTPTVQVNVDAHLEVLGGRLTDLLTRHKAAVIEGELADERTK